MGYMQKSHIIHFFVLFIVSIVLGVFFGRYMHSDFDQYVIREIRIPIIEKRFEVIAQDAHQKRMLTELKDLLVWAEGRPLFISEMGVPYDRDSDSYRRLLEKFFLVTDRYDISVTPWAVGELWGEYKIAPHRAVTLEDHSLSSTFVYTGSSTDFFRGVNLAGAEFGLDPDAGGALGSLGDQYTYHEDSDLWGKIAQKGYTHVRFPYRLERLHDVVTGEIRESDGQALLAALERARQANVKVILDPHNYGALRVEGQKKILGSDDFSTDLYRKMLMNLVDHVASYDDTVDIIGLMNEPKNLPPSEWEIYAQIGLDALRDAGWQGTIEVPTGKWQGAKDVVKIHPKPWIEDPLDRFVYGIHQYYDYKEEGVYRSSYDEDERRIERLFPAGVVEFEE